MSDPADPVDAEPDPPARRRRTTLANRVVVALLCALLGFAVVLQVQRTAAGDTLATARPDDLVQILDGLQRREDDLNVEIAELQGTLGRLQQSGASSEEALAEAERQAEALGILTGTVPATGPGVSIVIRDPGRPHPAGGDARRHPGIAQRRRRGLPGRRGADRGGLGVHRFRWGDHR